MLNTLRIKNLALVEDLTLDFQPGYNAITGETGAGKSIIIGALTLLLGQRADRTLLRAGADSCTVEATFDIGRLGSALPSYLEENGLEPCDHSQLLLKRSFTASGTNRQFVNGSATTLQVLTRIGDWLVDLHGPHEHQSLLHPARQLDLLDASANLAPQRDAFASLVLQLRALHDRKAALVTDDATYARQLDLLRHQVREIGAANLLPGEESSLQEDHARAHHAARLLELSQAALQLLSADDSGLLNLSGSLGRTLHEIQRIDPATTTITSLHDQLSATLRELQTDLGRYSDRIDLDPARLQELEERLNLLQSLKRKYGTTIDAILEHGRRARAELDALEGREAELARIQVEAQRLATLLQREGAALTAVRLKAIPKLAKAVAIELAALGFKQSRFDIQLQARPDSPTADLPPASGLDSLEFLFAPNPGEPPRPLRAIASSGEMARVMLAIKTVLAAHDNVPLLIFDEVDANIGGETAHAVGAKMQAIGRQRQVLCITHLAPVAAAAPSHFVVNKEVRDGRTLTTVELLSPADRVTELARMLGGQTDAARRHARELLGVQNHS